VNELLMKGHMSTYDHISFAATYHSGERNFIRDGNGVFYDKDGPVKVLTNPREVTGAVGGNSYSPITADYDLFGIYPKTTQSANIRPLRSAPVLTRGTERLREIAAPLLQKSPNYSNAQENPDMGNLHEFGKRIVKSLNKEIERAGYTGGNLVWHNDETGNPFSPGFDPDDKPIFFIPREHGPRQVESKSELLALHNELKRLGYQPEYSAVFGF
jgi:insecticidal toxin complex protein TccC